MRVLHKHYCTLSYAHTTILNKSCWESTGRLVLSSQQDPSRHLVHSSREKSVVACGITLKAHRSMDRKKAARNHKSFIYKYVNYLTLPVVLCMQLCLKKCSNLIHKEKKILILAISKPYYKVLPFKDSIINYFLVIFIHTRIICLPVSRISQVSPKELN